MISRQSARSFTGAQFVLSSENSFGFGHPVILQYAFHVSVTTWSSIGFILGRAEEYLPIFWVWSGLDLCILGRAVVGHKYTYLYFGLGLGISSKSEEYLSVF